MSKKKKRRKIMVYDEYAADMMTIQLFLSGQGGSTMADLLVLRDKMRERMRDIVDAVNEGRIRTDENGLLFAEDVMREFPPPGLH